jgi:hypothetical protein
MTSKNLMIANFLTVLIIEIAMLQPSSAHSEALPEQRDIPEELSTVICPDLASTRFLMDKYYRVNGNGIFDIYYFFDGLAATGCEPGSGPLRVEEVLSRKVLLDGRAGRYMAYKALRPGGDTVFGIVNEVLNDTHPRTAFGQWMQLHAPSDRLVNHPGGGKLYQCQSPDAARQVIRVIPPVAVKGAANPEQDQARDQAFADHGCALAHGEFTITAVGASAFISTGPEAGEDWTALEATDANGQVVGLVYDASTM